MATPTDWPPLTAEMTLAWETAQKEAWAVYNAETARAFAECFAAKQCAKTPEESDAAFVKLTKALADATAIQRAAACSNPENDPSRRSTPDLNVMVFNNTSADIRMFEPAIRAHANGAPLSDDVADMFSVKILDMPWSVLGNSGDIRAIVEWA